MNYRHAFHAGNFADVLKHAVLALCLEHLKQKPAPFRVIDTHAGAGRYDLASVEAGRTGEWAGGIGRLAGVDAGPLPPAIAESLAPYLSCVRTMNGGGGLGAYPGSPLIARALLRSEDYLIANELHPGQHAALAAEFAGDAQVRVMALDGWAAVKALLPPPERRGLLLIDPPFEATNDFEKLAAALKDARRRFATGMMVAWYPVKDATTVAAFFEQVAALSFEKLLRAELMIAAPNPAGRLTGCGVLIVNPPWTLRENLEALGPFLAARLAQGPGARFALE